MNPVTPQPKGRQTQAEMENDEEGDIRANLQRQGQVRKMVADSIKRSQTTPMEPSKMPPGQPDKDASA